MESRAACARSRSSASSASVTRTPIVRARRSDSPSRGLAMLSLPAALARCVHYGRLDQRDFERQTGAASCLLLILAAIIYLQIREIDRVLSEAGSDADDLNFELLSHISPIGWDNILLYGEYQLNRSLVRSERLSV